MNSPTSLSGSFLKQLARLGFAAALFYSLGMISIGWNQPLLDLHSYRQTQTAISVWALLQGGPWLAYETPVLGSPWSVPREFPLYQWMAAFLVRFIHLPLDQAGRWVSAVCFYLGLVPAASILKTLKMEEPHRWALLSLWIISPFYLFWARAFMIESMALTLGLFYAAACLQFWKTRNGAFAVGGLVWGILAGLVKITTFWGCLLGAGLIFMVMLGRDLRGQKQNALSLLLFAVLPLCAVFLWVQFADHLKSLNPVAREYITSDVLMDWNFGTWRQKWDAAAWLGKLDRVLIDVFGFPYQFFQVKVAAAVFCVAAGGFLKPYRRLFWSCIFLFAAVIFTFTNLHFVHTYYSYANAFLLIAAAVCAGLNLRAQPSVWLKAAGTLWIGAIFLMEIQAFQVNGRDYPFMRKPHVLEAADWVRANVTEDKVLVTAGLGTSPEIPYYSRRRALMIPDSFLNREELWNAAIQKTGKQSVGAWVLCGESRGQVPLWEKRAGQTWVRPDYEDENCRVYLPVRETV